MAKFLDLNPEVFAIDINDLSLRMVKLRKSGASFKVSSYSDLKIRPGIIKDGVIQEQEELIKIIRLACSSVHGKRLGTKYVIVSLPEEKSFSQIIQIAKMTPEELKTAVPYEAENYIPLPIDKVYLDYQVIGEHRNDPSKLDLLVNVIPKPIIDAYVDTIKKANLIPCILEVESQAIVRALMKMGENHPSTIFIDFGETKTSFIIVAGNSIRFTSSIPVSSQQLTQAIAENLGLFFEKAEELKTTYGLKVQPEENYDIRKIMEPILNELILQVKRYIAFYQGHAGRDYSSAEGGAIEKIVLCGGGANLKGLPEFLFAGLQIRVEIGDPLVNLSVSKNVRWRLIPQQKVLSFSTAIGLALRAADYKNSEDGRIL